MITLIALLALSLPALVVVGARVVELVRERHADRVPYLADPKVIDALQVIRSHRR